MKDRQLNGWYRTLDALHAHKQTLEKELFLRLRDLFSLRAEMVFYDLTSTYFEGRGPEGLAQHGYSRDGKPRNRTHQGSPAILSLRVHVSTVV